jgi:hypothetical protein
VVVVLVVVVVVGVVVVVVLEDELLVVVVVVAWSAPVDEAASAAVGATSPTHANASRRRSVRDIERK